MHACIYSPALPAPAPLLLAERWLPVTTATTKTGTHCTMHHAPCTHLVLHPLQQSFLALARPAGVIPVPDPVTL